MNAQVFSVSNNLHKIVFLFINHENKDLSFVCVINVFTKTKHLPSPKV